MRHSAARDNPRSNHTGNGRPLTLAMLADHKRLPVAFLSDLGLHDLPRGGVGIPYYGPTGEDLEVKRRTHLVAKEGSYWPKGKPLAAYGQWKLSEARRAGFLILDEGESDCWALWYHELPALGLPGANTAKALTMDLLDGIDKLYVHREPDRGGASFVRSVAARLGELGYPGRAFELRMPDGAKDPADLHADDPAQFLEKLEAAVRASFSLEIPSANGRNRAQVEPGAFRGDAWEGAASGEAPDLAGPGVLLSTVQPKAVEWLWPGRIPLGRLTILDGDPGLGKSVLTMDLAGRVSAGLGMPDGTPCRAAGVVVLNNEDGRDDTVVPRLLASGGDLSRVLALDIVPDGDSERLISLPADLDYLRQAIERVAANLVIVDPLMAWIGGEHNTHRDQDCRRALHPLGRLAEDTGAAVLVVRHLNKMAGGNPLYRGGGSIGIIGAARSGLLVAKDPDNPDRRVLASVKCNLAKLPASLAFDLSPDDQGRLRVGWVGESTHTADSLLAVPQNDEDRDAVQEAVEVLRAILADGQLTADEVKRQARRAGLADRTLYRAKAILGVRAVRVGFGPEGRWHWSLKESAAGP